LKASSLTLNAALLTAFYCLAIFFLIGTNNFDFLGNRNWHDQQRIAEEIFLVLLLPIWLLKQTRLGQKNQSKQAIPQYAANGFMLFGTLGLASALLAQYLLWALLEWSLILSLLISMLFIAHLRMDAGERFDRVVLGIFAAACLTYFEGFSAAYFATLMGDPLNAWELFHGFSNVRFFGQFQSMTLPLLALLVYYSKSTLQRTTSFALLACWWMLAFVSGTRGTWLGMLVAAVLIGLTRWRTGRTWLRLQATASAIGLGLYALLFYAVPYWTGNVEQLINRLPDITGLSKREVIWEQAWKIIKQHPLLGVGPMHFAAVPNMVGAHPHNSILQLAAEWGIPAMLLLVGFAVYGLIRFSAAIHRQSFSLDRPPMLQIALFAALVAASTQSLVDGVIVMPYTQTVLMLIAGWALGVHLSATATLHTRQLPTATMVMLTVTATLLLSTMVYVTLPQIPELKKREDAYISQHGGHLLPRFWRQGWIAK
jgi:putative inorganic carbon (HCO3(-)) transporter